jgi:hypothetical protein
VPRGGVLEVGDELGIGHLFQSPRHAFMGGLSGVVERLVSRRLMAVAGVRPTSRPVTFLRLSARPPALELEVRPENDQSLHRCRRRHWRMPPDCRRVGSAGGVIKVR